MSTENSKNTTSEMKKPNKYPKTLTIMINTRIRGFPKIKYTPAMTIPGIKSDTVYFEPLIKLDSKVTSTIPPGYPPTGLFTQFFDIGEFDSLLNRTVSSSYIGHIYYDLQEATEKRLVDKNIRITLDQLFKPNNQFYLNGEPFTIYNYSWYNGDWIIDTKDFEEQFLNDDTRTSSMYGYSYGYDNPFKKKLKNEASKELEELRKYNPEMLQGKFYKQMSNIRETTYGMSQADKAVYVMTNLDLLKQLPNRVQNLLGLRYTPEQALNMDPNTPNFVSDPIALSLIYSADRDYNKVVSKSIELKKKYDAYEDAAKKLKMKQDEFEQTYGLSIKESFVKTKQKGGSVYVGGDATSDQIQKNKVQWLHLLNGEIKMQQYIQTVIVAGLAVLDKRDKETKEPEVDVLPSWEDWEKEVKLYMQTMQSKMKTMQKFIQDRIANKNNPSVFIDNQLQAIQLLLDIKNKEDKVIDSRMQLFPKMFRNQPVDENVQLLLQNLLQRVVSVVDNYISLLQKESTSTQTELETVTESAPVAPKNTRSLLQIKGDLDKYIQQFITLITSLKQKEGFQKRDIFIKQEYKQQFIDATTTILNIQQSFLNVCILVYQILNSYMQIQNEYITAFVSFYDELYKIRTEELKTMKGLNIITGYKEKNPVDIYQFLVENTYIEFDISCYRSLLKDRIYQQNIYNVQKMMTIYVAELKQSVDKKYNYREELEKWFDNPSLLTLLEMQYDAYYMEILGVYEKNQETMWRVLNEETEQFFTFIKNTTLKKINDSYLLLDGYEKKYDKEKRISFLNKLQLASVSIQKQNLLSYMSSFANTSQDEYTDQRKMYMELKQSQIIAYEMITIYARISSKHFGREISYLTVQKNIASLEEQKYDVMRLYLDIINKNKYLIKGMIPYSIYWDTASIDINILLMIQDNNNKVGIVKDRISSIENKIRNLEIVYQDTIDLLIPEITEDGILKTCNTITAKELEEEESDVPLNDNEELKKAFFADFYANVDGRLERYFKTQMNTLLKEYFYDIETKDRQNQSFYVAEQLKQTEGWRVSTTQSGNRSNSFLICLATALNGQLQLDQKFTVNPYTRCPYHTELYETSEYPEYFLPFEQANEFAFTETQLMQLIYDKMTEDDYAEIQIWIYFLNYFLLVPFIIKYKGIIDPGDYKEMIKQMETKIEMHWKPFQYFYKKGNTNESFSDFNEFIEYISDIIPPPYEKETFFPLLQSMLFHMTEYKAFIKSKSIYHHTEIFSFILERELKIKMVKVNTYTNNLFDSFMKKNFNQDSSSDSGSSSGSSSSSGSTRISSVNNLLSSNFTLDGVGSSVSSIRSKSVGSKSSSSGSSSSDSSSSESVLNNISYEVMKRPVYFISNETKDNTKYTIEQGLIIEPSLNGTLYTYFEEALGLELKIIEWSYYLEKLNTFLYEKYKSYNAQTPKNEKYVVYIKLLLSYLYEIIHNVKINGIFLIKDIEKDLDKFFYYDDQDGGDKLIYNEINLPNYWETLLNDSLKQITTNTNMEVFETTSIGTILSILLKYVKKIRRKKIAYRIQKGNFQTVNITSERLLDWEQPILNMEDRYVDEGLYYIKDTEDTVAKYEWNYVFLLCDNEKDKEPIYYNIYNEKTPRFVYSLENIPSLFLYLVFKNYYKINQDIFSKTNENLTGEMYWFYNRNEAFNKKMIEYENKYKKNIPIGKIQTDLPIIPNLTEYEWNQLEQENKSLLQIEAVVNQKKDPLSSIQIGGSRGGGSRGGAQDALHPSSYFVNVSRNQNIQSSFFQNNLSGLSYYVIIDLNLYPGKDGIPITQKLILGCQSRYEKIRQSWAKMFGFIYRPTEYYVPGYVPPSRIKYDKKTGGGSRRKRGFFRKQTRRGKYII
jgi:hypothetical protein